MREPDFNNLLKVLKRQVPDRPTLFEFFLNLPLYKKLAGNRSDLADKDFYDYELLIPAFKNAGYDYVTLQGSDFEFPKGDIHTLKSRSLNEGTIIKDRESYEKYSWPDPDSFDYSRLEKCAALLPEGMKVVIWVRGGVLENVIQLVGYENLCYILLDDPEFAEELFAAVGSRLLRYYEICAVYDTVGALIVNDDWGFNTQTMLSPDNMRQYVFPWHKKIVDIIHKSGKPSILHSCGNLESVFEDIITDMKYDAKHSYEDKIVPVEEAYEKWGSRIAILGGIDMDFVCRSTPEKIRERSLAMLHRSKERGGYALGTGNSVPDYLPDDNYFAMTSAVLVE